MRSPTGPLFIDAGGRQLSLANDYASWLQNHLVNRADVTFACEPAPARLEVTGPR